MARISFILLLLLISFPAQAVYDVKDSGKAWYLQDDSLPIISIKIAFEKAGYAYDPKGKEGLANFVSGMLNEGAGEYSAQQFQKLLDENAIDFRANADADNFYITVKTLSQNLPLTMKMLNAALTKPSFGAKELETVRGQILTGIAKTAENPNKLVGQKLMQTIFGNHPYANIKEGSKKSVKALTAIDMQEFVSNNFAKNNAKISIVGNVNAKRVENMVVAIKKSMPMKAKVNILPKFQNYPEAFDEKVKTTNPQAIVLFVSKGIKREDPNFYAAYVLNHIIGGSGFQSRLYKQVREARGLSYYVATNMTILDKAETIAGTLATTTQQVKEAREVVVDVLRNARDNGVTAEELADAKSYITGSFPLNLDTNAKIASYLLMMQTNDLGVNYLKNRNNLINSVTLEQVNAVAKQLIAPEKLGFVVVGE